MTGLTVSRFISGICAAHLVVFAVTPTASVAQSIPSPSFCYSSIDGVFCFTRDSKGRTEKVDPPPPSGGRFSQEDRYSYSRRRFGVCSDAQRKALCSVEADGCKQHADSDAPRPPGFPTLAQKLLEAARKIPVELGAPAGKDFNYSFSYNLSCEGKNVGKEEPICEYSIACTVRGDFSF